MRFAVGIAAALFPLAAQAAGMPQLRPEHFVPELVWLVILFAAFYLVVKTMALPSIQGVLAARQDKIDADVKAAETLHEAAQTALKAYEATLAHARADAHKTIAEKQAELAAEADAHKRKIEADLNAKLAHANEQIRAKRDAVMANLRNLATDAAGAVVARILSHDGADGGRIAQAVDAEMSKVRA